MKIVEQLQLERDELFSKANERGAQTWGKEIEIEEYLVPANKT